jgi:hypothetical protein
LWVQGKVATAARKSKGGIMGMLANPRKLVNGHKKIFKVTTAVALHRSTILAAVTQLYHAQSK